MSDLAKRLNIMADWFDQDPEHAYKNTISLLREAAAALDAPTPSEQRASAKPQDEAEMREVLEREFENAGYTANGCDTGQQIGSPFSVALAAMRTYAATERARARREAMEEAGQQPTPEVKAEEHKCFECGGELSVVCLACNPELQRNDAGEGEGRYVNCQAFYPHCTNKAKCAVCGGHVSEHRPVSPPPAPPDPLDRPVTYRAIIEAFNTSIGGTDSEMWRFIHALQRSAGGG